MVCGENQKQRHLYQDNMRGSRNFSSGERVQAPQLILQFTEGFITHFPGGSNFIQGGGVQLLISIETHITITCDFPGGSGPLSPLDPHMDNVAFWHESLRLRRACAASF